MVMIKISPSPSFPLPPSVFFLSVPSILFPHPPRFHPFFSPFLFQSTPDFCGKLKFIFRHKSAFFHQRDTAYLTRRTEWRGDDAVLSRPKLKTPYLPFLLRSGFNSKECTCRKSRGPATSTQRSALTSSSCWDRWVITSIIQQHSLPGDCVP